MRIAVWFVLIACVIYCAADKDTRRKGSKRRKQVLDSSVPTNTTSLSVVSVDEPSSPSFSPWTGWSRCTRRCRQRRRRRCVRPSLCGTSLLTEERACFGGRCDERGGQEKTPRKDRKDKNKDDEFRILHHVSSSPYGEWGEWGECSRTTCLTRRTRICQDPDVCGTKSLEESAICYAEGSKCERMHKKKKKNRKKSYKADESVIHPLDEVVSCGVSPLASSSSIPDLWNKLRIIGGREAKKGSWPWQLTVLNKYREPFCGATLISPEWAITAAHCLRRRLSVMSGEHSLMSTEGTEQETTVWAQYPHPDYDPDTVSNDVALLRLRRPFRMDDHTRAACLPDGETVLTTGIILGWGKKKGTAIYGTDKLHQAEVPVVPLDECRTSYGTFPLSKRMLCAGYKAGRVDSCAGDSGGPLLARRESDDKWAVFGVTSFGDGCGQKGKFGIYTDVSKYVKWIRRTISRHTK
ncbi:hypothetical protein JTE90_006349 [Oedothorax gibbosus]|uniref:limulus clotting factor C n=1 Tax=Oedothorax gibbosus TaxID=931172 RepID=A0AAV6VXF6_9ARAC|nr:hypothetical protein JTE90_006349 [Oedothorax gibbosus]